MNRAVKDSGFVMPAEFEKQKLVWIVWPHNKDDWPGYFTKIPLNIANIISKISKSQKTSKSNEKLIKNEGAKKHPRKYYQKLISGPI